MCGLSGVAMIATFLVKEYTLDQTLSGEQVFVDSGKARNGRAIERSSDDEAEKAVSDSNVGDVRLSQ